MTFPRHVFLILWNTCISTLSHSIKSEGLSSSAPAEEVGGTLRSPLRAQSKSSLVCSPWRMEVALGTRDYLAHPCSRAPCSACGTIRKHSHLWPQLRDPGTLTCCPWALCSSQQTLSDAQAVVLCKASAL